MTSDLARRLRDAVRGGGPFDGGDDLVARQALQPVTQALGSSVPAWTVRQTLVINEHKYQPFAVEGITEATTLTDAQVDEDLIRTWDTAMVEYQRRVAL